MKEQEKVKWCKLPPGAADFTVTQKHTQQLSISDLGSTYTSWKFCPVIGQFFIKSKSTWILYFTHTQKYPLAIALYSTLSKIHPFAEATHWDSTKDTSAIIKQLNFNSCCMHGLLKLLIKPWDNWAE